MTPTTDGAPETSAAALARREQAAAELARREKAARDDRMHPALASSLDALMSVQRPVVLAHIRGIRAKRPDATPAEILRILEVRYLAAVTTGGAAVGASSAIPAVGVGASLVLSGVETAGFLEASALFAQSITELHGIAVDDPERARTLVMSLILGAGGRELVAQFAGQAAGGGTSRSAYWGEMITHSLPRAALGPISDQIQKAFLRKFAVAQGSSVIGRLIPFGVGAVVGGTGNHLLGRQIVKASQTAFPPLPAEFPANLDPRPPRDPDEPSRVRWVVDRMLPTYPIGELRKRLPGRPKPLPPGYAGAVSVERADPVDDAD